MKRATWATWLLLGLLIVLTPMAWASPIDPSWTKGVYDDADFDDVIAYLTSGTVAVPVLPLTALLPILVSSQVEPEGYKGLCLSAPPSPHAPRAPPLG